MRRIEIADDETKRCVVFVEEDTDSWRRSVFVHWGHRSKQERVECTRGHATVDVTRHLLAVDVVDTVKR